MKRIKENMWLKFLTAFVFVVVTTVLSPQKASAVSKEEVETEIQKVAQEDPELAGEMKKELATAIQQGEVTLEIQDHADGEAGKGTQIDLESPEGRAKAVADIDAHKDELLGKGLTEADIGKLKELVASGEHDPEKFKEIFEKDGHPIFEGGKEGMEQGGREMFERMMGEVAGHDDMKGEYEKAMKEFGGDREAVEKYMKEQGGGRDEFERVLAEHGGDREMAERYREMGEKEGREFGERMEREAREFAEREAIERPEYERPNQELQPPQGQTPPPEFQPPPPPQP